MAAALSAALSVRRLAWLHPGSKAPGRPAGGLSPDEQDRHGRAEPRPVWVWTGRAARGPTGICYRVTDPGFLSPVA